jgi:broad specificity phosphatase PhoE
MIILLRHGVTHYNVQKRFQGQAQIELSETGRNQVLLAAGLLENFFSEHKINPSNVLFFSSDLIRCIQTAGIVQTQISQLPPYQLKYSLREFDSGKFSHFTAEELKQKQEWEEYLNSYEQNPLETRWPGAFGESREMVLLRLEEFFQFTFHHAEKCAEEVLKSPMLVCTHGGVIQIILEKFGLTSVSLPLFVGNADVCIVDFHKNSWRLLKHYKIGNNIRAKT